MEQINGTVSLMETIDDSGQFTEVWTRERLFPAIAGAWHSYRRRTVEDAWRLGKALVVAHEMAMHGEWMPWLADIGMHHEMARRLIRLAKGYAEIPQIVEFGTVDDALKALRPASPPRRNPPPATPARDAEAVDAEFTTAGPVPAAPPESVDRRKDAGEVVINSQVLLDLQEREREGAKAQVLLDQLGGTSGTPSADNWKTVVEQKNEKITERDAEIKRLSGLVQRQKRKLNNIQRHLAAGDVTKAQILQKFYARAAQ